MKRVLVTGGTGFIGRHAVSVLSERGYEVHSITRGELSGSSAPVSPNYYLHRGSITDATGMRRIMESIRPSYLLHLAWFVEAGKYWLSGENFRWVEASLTLLRLFQEFGGRRAVMAGTCAEYDWRLGYLREDLTARLPNHPYGVCKNALYELAKSYCAQFEISFAWGRVFFAYGPGEPSTKFVSSIASAIMRGKVARCECPQLIRDYLYVEDIAMAFAALLDCDVNGAVNVASGQPIALGSIANSIATILQAEHVIEFGSAQNGDPILLLGDNRRLTHEVGWQPTFSLEQGLGKTINWIKEELRTL